MKHYGDAVTHIEDNLKYRDDVTIWYLTEDLNLLKKYDKSIYVSAKYIHYINSINVWLTTSSIIASSKFKCSPLVFEFLHCYINGILDFANNNSSNFIDSQREYLNSGNVIFMSDCKVFNFTKSLMDEYSNNVKLIKAGYPSLDMNIREYEAVEAKTENIIMICLSIDNYFILRELIQGVLSLNFKVIVRPHPGLISKDSAQKVIRNYRKNKNFIASMSSKLSMQDFANITTLIVDISSIAYTFPLTAFKKAILYSDNPDIFKKSYKNICFYEPSLHEIMYDARELKEILKRTNGPDVRGQINKYMDGIFNLKTSSLFISEFIINELNKLK